MKYLYNVADLYTSTNKLIQIVKWFVWHNTDNFDEIFSLKCKKKSRIEIRKPKPQLIAAYG